MKNEERRIERTRDSRPTTCPGGSVSIFLFSLSSFLFSALAAAGCQQPAGEIFVPVEPAVLWPAPPATPRYRYVGALRDSSDLKPPPKPFQGLGDLLIGKKRAEPLYGPRDVVSTADGQRIWIADPGGRCVHMFDLESREYRKINQIGDRHLLSPVGLALGPQESLYICDSEGVAIYRVSSVGGNAAESLRLPPEILRPVALQYNPIRGELYVVDVSAHDIKVLDTTGRLLRLIGRRGTGPGEFNFPTDLVLRGNVLWVVDTGNQRIQTLTGSGEPLTQFGQAGDAPGDLALPKSIALDRERNVYVVDARFENIQIFDRSGQLLMVFGEEGSGPGEFWLPAGIHIDARNRIWVCDSYNRRVQVFEFLERSDGTTIDDADRAPSKVMPLKTDTTMPSEPQASEVPQ